jgi:hypothetical protein
MKLSEPKKKEIARRQIQRRLQKRVGRRAGPGSESLREKDRGISAMGGYLVGGQAKIAAKAPPTNKIDEKDFAVLRAEKAKGRGMGLQDEKMKPGKVKKAMLGALAVGAGLLGAKKLLGKKAKAKADSGSMRGIGKGMRAAGFGKNIIEMLKKQKLGTPGIKGPVMKRGGMLKARRGTIIKPKGPGVLRMKPQDRYGQPMKPKPIKPKKKMGGGMMMRPNPMGYKKGVMVKTKIGRNKPTKMY